MYNFISIGSGVLDPRGVEFPNLPLTVWMALTTVLRTNVLHCDATFKAVTVIYYQLLTTVAAIGQYQYRRHLLLLVSLFPGCVAARKQAWPQRRLPEPRQHQAHYSLHPASCVCHCCLPPTSRLICNEIRATICNDMRTARQLQQLVTYVQSRWIDSGNATTSTNSSNTSDTCEVCLIQSSAGAMRACAFLCSAVAQTLSLLDMLNPRISMLLRLYAWLCRACTLSGQWRFCDRL